MLHSDDPRNIYAKHPEKITFLNPCYLNIRVRIRDRGLRNDSFSEVFAFCVRTKWMPPYACKFCFICAGKTSKKFAQMFYLLDLQTRFRIT